MNRYRDIITENTFYKGLRIRFLVPEDLEMILQLQFEVYAKMPDQTDLVLTTQEEFIDELENDLCIGAFDADRLVAVSVMLGNRDFDRNIGGLMGFAPEDCVTFDSSFVHPDYRGRGLQQYFTRIRIDAAKKAGAKLAFATISPTNSYSLNNLTVMGFQIWNEAVLYGGYERYVMIREI